MILLLNIFFVLLVVKLCTVGPKTWNTEHIVLLEPKTAERHETRRHLMFELI